MMPRPRSKAAQAERELRVGAQVLPFAEPEREDMRLLSIWAIPGATAAAQDNDPAGGRSPEGNGTQWDAPRPAHIRQV